LALAKQKQKSFFVINSSPWRYQAKRT